MELLTLAHYCYEKFLSCILSHEQKIILANTLPLEHDETGISQAGVVRSRGRNVIAGRND